MRSLLVVFEPPPIAGLANVGQTHEQVLEAFDTGVPVGFARLVVPGYHAMMLGPLSEDLAQELLPVGGAQYLRQTALAAQFIEDA